MLTAATNQTTQPASGGQPDGSSARPLSSIELEELASRIIERMKKEIRQDLQREGKHS